MTEYKCPADEELERKIAIDEMISQGVCPICEEEIGTNPNCSRCKQWAEAKTIGEFR